MTWSMKKVVSFNKEKNNLWHALAVRHFLSCWVNLRFPSRVYIVGVKKVVYVFKQIVRSGKKRTYYIKIIL